jgi:phosphoglycolate phosphatase
MERIEPRATKLLVLDIDNTVFDWVGYYVTSFSALLKTLEGIVRVPYATLAEEAKAVFNRQGSIEYPFLVQELPSVIKFYGPDIDRMLLEAVGPCRVRFNVEAEKLLVPYAGVYDTLAAIRGKYPKLSIAALTDAPRYIAMWKLNKLGILQFFDAIYGLGDPKIPISDEYGKVKVDAEILHKHLKQNDFGFAGDIRVLPDEYEKPGLRGLKTVLMDFGLDEDSNHKKAVVWCGDNLNKDVGLGKRLGIRTVWARYGANVPPKIKEKLAEFSPEHKIHRNLHLMDENSRALVPDITIDSFSEVLSIL